MLIQKKLNSSNYKKVLKNSDAILVPGGFGDRGIEGMILAARFARENEGSIFRHLFRSSNKLLKWLEIYLI